MIYLLILLFAVAVNPAFADSTLKSTPVAIPGGQKGIGFDDLVYAPELHQVLVPAGHTGQLYLIDPGTYEMANIGGFSSSPSFHKGHDEGISSVTFGDGFLFVADHGKHQLDAVNVKTGKIVVSAHLVADPDIIRFVKSKHEVWVTEPDNIKKGVEVFLFKAGDKPKLYHFMFIKVPDGPESLTIDNTHGRAYSNLGSKVGVIDVKTHGVIAQWPNTCDKSRGTAIDEGKNILLVACGEGKAVVFDLNRHGKKVSSIATGPGADLIDYNAALSHLYITGSKNATLTVLAVSNKGALSTLSVSPAAKRSHCVVGDDQNNIWVCDPAHGQLLRYKDSL